MCLATMPRKRTNFVLDDRVLAALKEMAQDANTSANRFVENLLFEAAKQNGKIAPDAKPLGETRGRPSDETNEKTSDAPSGESEA